ncbi:MAG: hypothetical protein JJU36_11385 [Phycisphaeraceae bacterium]|nr:hypothetical protein [Phycisphaeraceae bacterium]
MKASIFGAILAGFGASASGAVIPADFHFNTMTGAIYALGSVGTGTHVQVGGDIVGGSIALGNHTMVDGTLYSTGSIGLGNHSTVQGDAFAVTSLNANNHSGIHGHGQYGTTSWTHNHAQIAGGVHQTNPDITAQLLFGPEFGHSGGSNFWLSNHETADLGAGAHGAFSTGQHGTVTLTAGTYHFSSFWLGNHSKLAIDTSAGEVNLIIDGDFSTGQHTGIFRSGDYGVNIHAAGNIWLGADFLGEASFFAHDGSLSTGTKAQIEGSLYASGNLWLGNQTMVEGMSFFTGSGGGGAAAIPEPASAMLLAAGAIVLLRRGVRSR